MANPDNHPHNSFAGRGVYLLDDHEVVRRGLRQLIESDGLSISTRKHFEEARAFLTFLSRPVEPAVPKSLSGA
jgi:FixJ family two-component response regulator